MKRVLFLILTGALSLLAAGCHGGGGSSSGPYKPDNSSSSSGKDESKSGGGSGSGGGSAGSSAGKAGQPDKSTEGGATAADFVKISRGDQQRAGIRVGDVLVERVPRSVSVAGQVTMDEKHTSHVGVLADGRIMSVSVLPGAYVRRGEVLGTLHSHTVHETVGALVQAYAAVDRQKGGVVFAKEAQERYHHLYSIQAASLEEAQRSDQGVLEAERLLVDAQANVHMEREHLSELLQVPPESITLQNIYDRELIPIRSPISGVVMTRNVSVGQVVQTGFDAFDVSDLSTVWVTAALNQQDLPLIHNGALAEVVTAGYPDQIFHGRVEMVGDMLDSQTRTVPVRVVVPNPDRKLRPGMFASAHLAEPATRDAFFVPESALQDINGMEVVFVTHDGESFKAQTVEAGTRSRDKAEIVTGLVPGTHVVTQGAYMVKSEMLKNTMGGG